MHIFILISLLLRVCSGRPQQQAQLVTQVLPPSQGVSMGSDALGPMQSSAASLGQILVNLLNYKLQWLNQIAGHFTGLGPAQGSLKPGLLGALGGAFGAPAAPGFPGPLHYGQPHHGFPFMTTLVTTLSGHSPTAPGITIAGTPVNHLAAPGLYPGAPTTAPPQDFHWIPPFAPDPQAPVAAPLPQAQPLQAAASVPPPTQQQLAVQPVPASATIPVIPAIDDVPVTAVIQPPAAAPAATPATAPAATPAAPAAPAPAVPVAAPPAVRDF